MKIKVTAKNDYTSIMPVWRGKIVDNLVWRNGNLDFKQSWLRTQLKKAIREHEELKRRLDVWAEEAGF